MILYVLDGFVGSVEMNGTIRLVVVADVLLMQDFVRKASLHGKALQWQAEHQQDAEESAHIAADYSTGASRCDS